MIKRESFEDAKKRQDEKAARKALKEAEKLVRTGEMTQEEFEELLQKYMDTIEYNDEDGYVTFCGGIQPLPIIPPPDTQK